MDKIKVFKACAASGESLEAGKTYSVPDQVSEKDAVTLIGMGKAEKVAAPKSKQAGE